MSSRVLRTVLLSILGLTATVYAADPYAGTYKGDTLSVEIAPAGDGYSGTIHLASRRSR